MPLLPRGVHCFLSTSLDRHSTAPLWFYEVMSREMQMSMLWVTHIQALITIPNTSSVTVSVVLFHLFCYIGFNISLILAHPPFYISICLKPRGTAGTAEFTAECACGSAGVNPHYHSSNYLFWKGHIDWLKHLADPTHTLALKCCYDLVIMTPHYL